MTYWTSLLCVVFLVAGCTSGGLGNLGDLVVVNVLHRHGDRTPVSSYPTDPFRNVTFWPDGWGQLTNRGKEQAFSLGKWLRERYENFLPRYYSRDDIHIQSTDVDRTLMTAETSLAGLYPPEGRQAWNPDLVWQAIPVHTIPEKDDMILAAQRPCPRYDREYKNVLNSKEIQDFNKKHAVLYSYLSKHSGALVYDAISLEYLYDTLHVEDLFNLSLPKWTQKVYPEVMSPIADFSFTLQSFSKTMQRLKSGPLLKQMISSMQDAVNGVKERKLMYVYSAHDTTVANLMMTLGIFNMRAPPYVATLILELRKYKDEYNIVVLYRNGTDEPYILSIPNCESECSFEKFIEITRSRIPENWEEECKIPIIFEFNLNTAAVMALALSGFLGLLLVFSISFSVVYWKKRSSTSYYYHHVHTEEP